MKTISITWKNSQKALRASSTFLKVGTFVGLNLAGMGINAVHAAPHTHGEGKLQILQAGSEWQFVLQLPAADVLGFEYAPSTASEKKRYKETQKVFKDGWLLTGDLAKMDEDGFVFITGRKKEMITNCGFKIYPQEVEKVLMQHAEVNEAGVCAIPDGFRGEAVKAVVVLNQNNSISEKELIEHCKNKLAPFKVPKQIAFVEELPKSFLGKVVRRLLNEEA